MFSIFFFVCLYYKFCGDVLLCFFLSTGDQDPLTMQGICFVSAVASLHWCHDIQWLMLHLTCYGLLCACHCAATSRICDTGYLAAMLHMAWRHLSVCRWSMVCGYGTHTHGAGLGVGLLRQWVQMGATSMGMTYFALEHRCGDILFGGSHMCKM